MGRIDASESLAAEPIAWDHEPDPGFTQVYADPLPYPSSVETAFEVYREADLSEIDKPDRTRFYDEAYPSELRKMVDHVIAVEGPVYFDVLVDRVSRAHSFQRAKTAIRDIITFALGRGRFLQTHDDGHVLIWPAGADTNALRVWRGTGSRGHHEVPLVELASLAKPLVAGSLDDEIVLRAMQEKLHLARLTSSTRERLQRALEIARNTG